VADDQARKRPGGPRLDPTGAPSVPVHFRLSATQYDRLYKEASTQRVGLADLIRAVIADNLRQP